MKAQKTVVMTKGAYQRGLKEAKMARYRELRKSIVKPAGWVLNGLTYKYSK
jgi:hypothetical protein